MQKSLKQGFLDYCFTKMCKVTWKKHFLKDLDQIASLHEMDQRVGWSDFWKDFWTHVMCHVKEPQIQNFTLKCCFLTWCKTLWSGSLFTHFRGYFPGLGFRSFVHSLILLKSNELRGNEWSWAIRSGGSEEMSDSLIFSNYFFLNLK